VVAVFGVAAAIAVTAALGTSSCVTRAARPLLSAGERVPDITAADQSGALLDLRQYRGRPLVVYFYPKDKTAG
jgi:hypothetical protein